MRCLVIGAGIVGLSTAYLLGKAGFEVTVVDKGQGPGLGASYANGAQLSYSYVAPLAGPGVIPSIPKYLLDPESPLRFRPELSFEQWAWCIRFLMACNKKKSDASTRCLYELAEASRRTLSKVIAEAGLSFDFSENGKMVVYDQVASFDKAKRDTELLAGLGCHQVVLDGQQCLEKEPGLRKMAGRIIGGILSPNDASGNCHKLCLALSEVISARGDGSAILPGIDVRRILTAGGMVSGVDTNAGILTADLYVLAAGMGVRPLSRGLGFDLPLYPLGGYSLTAAITNDNMAPAVSITDFGRKTVYARVGGQLRSAAFVEIGGAAHADSCRVQQLVRNSEEAFGDAADFSNAEIWRGFRPATPDGLPVVGRTPYGNLFINAGHGALGFTLAFGTAASVVQQILRRT